MLTRTQRIVLPLLLAVLAVTSLAAQAATERGLIYRIEGPQPSYLVGSIHVGNQGMYPLPTAMERAYENADTLVVEADIVGADQGRLMQLLASKGMYQGGDNLESELSGEQWRDVSAAAERYGLPLGMVRAQKPWLALQTLTVLAVQAEGYSEKLGVDRHFLTKAHEAGKRIEELEGLEQQLTMLSSMPAQEQQALLAYTASEIADGEIPMADMVEAWSSGRPETLRDQVRQQFPPELGGVYQRLIVDRNETMAARIDRMLSGGKSLFIVVGAAHLPGPEGLVELLEARDYSLEQM